jgi:hypothetical protein
VQALADIAARAGDAISASSFTSETGNLDVDADAGDIVGSVLYAKSGSADVLVGDQFDGSTVETDGAVTLDATWINNSTFVSESGLVDIAATAGDIVGGSATSKTDAVSAVAALNIVGLAVDAATTSTLAATGGSVVGGESLSGGAADIDAGAHIDGLMVEASSATLDAVNILNGGVTAVSGGVAASAAGYIANQDVNAATTADLDAVLDVTGTSVLAGAAVTVDAVSLHTSGVVAGGPVAVTLSEEMDGSTVNSLAAVTVLANNVTNSAVDADGVIDVDADMDVANSVFKGDAAGLAVDLLAQDGGIRNVDVLATAGSAALDAETEIDATDVQALADIAARAGNAIVASSFTTEMGDLDIDADAGDIVGSVFYAKTMGPAQDGGGINILVGDEFDGNVVEAMGDIDVSATWINGSTFVSEMGYVDIAATEGSIVGGSATSKASYVEATASSADPALGNITGLGVDAYTASTMGAGGSVVGGQTRSGGSADIDAVVAIDGLVVEASSATLDALQITNGSVATLGGNADLTAGGNISGQTVSALGDVNLDADQYVTGTGVSATGLVTVGGDGTTNNLVNSDLAGDLGVTVDVSDDVHGTRLTSINDIDVTAGQSIADTDMFTTTGDVDALATSMNIAGGSAVAETGEVDLDAGMTIDGTLVVAGGGDADLDAEDNVIAVDVTAGGDVNVGQNRDVNNVMNSTLAANMAANVAASDDVHNSEIAANEDITVLAASRSSTPTCSRRAATSMPRPRR